ncbi:MULTISPECIES: hypothetical protein [Mycobacteriaceae]|uniref:hypothetical protein n=1 Tax=Mycobacteriaceae TaxID=1762 RepID=UPI0007EF6663|nr:MULTISPECIES: hypothetical protein [Mycobacteriaceae]MDO2981414.1 hypothetical protein [Mycobacteroides abscessus subsp. abscessus]OBK72359.1 hypothetical protein A5654_08625 [Mycolicibacterium fortuitum]
MKYDPNTKTAELTDRNINALTAKLDDPQSARTLVSPCGLVMVRAVEDGERSSRDTSEGVVTVTRSELAQLLEGETVTVGDTAVVPVPDAAHYSSRPSGVVVMPSSGEVLEPETAHWRLRHVCEVCGKSEILTPSEAFDAGWDHPTRMGQFGVVSPRTCGSCPMSATVWAALVLEGHSREDLSEAQVDTLARILAEPMSITVGEPERKTISAPSMFELRPQIVALLADGWTMTRMDKPIAEGFGENVTVWFEREEQ